MHICSSLFQIHVNWDGVNCNCTVHETSTIVHNSLNFDVNFFAKLKDIFTCSHVCFFAYVSAVWDIYNCVLGGHTEIYLYMILQIVLVIFLTCLFICTVAIYTRLLYIVCMYNFYSISVTMVIFEHVHVYCFFLGL